MMSVSQPGTYYDNPKPMIVPVPATEAAGMLRSLLELRAKYNERADHVLPLDGLENDRLLGFPFTTMKTRGDEFFEELERYAKGELAEILENQIKCIPVLQRLINHVRIVEGFLRRGASIERDMSDIIDLAAKISKDVVSFLEDEMDATEMRIRAILKARMFADVKAKLDGLPDLKRTLLNASFLQKTVFPIRDINVPRLYTVPLTGSYLALTKAIEDGNEEMVRSEKLLSNV